MIREGWSKRRIAVVLYPFGAGAMATNVFFASLIGTWVGLPVISSGWSVFLGALLGAPVSWVFAGHMRKLMDQSDGR
jgi:hypothetical protein